MPLALAHRLLGLLKLDRAALLGSFGDHVNKAVVESLREQRRASPETRKQLTILTHPAGTSDAIWFLETRDTKSVFVGLVLQTTSGFQFQGFA